MGNYLSILAGSAEDLQAPVLSKAEVEIDIAKQKIDSEVSEIVQEIEAESLIEQNSLSETIDFEVDQELHDEDEIQQQASLGSDVAPSPVQKVDSITKETAVKKEKKWYHKFTGNVQRSEEVTLSILSERRIQAVEKRAKEQKAQLDKHLEQTKTRNKIRLLALQQKIHPDFRGKEWRFDEKKNFNFAVVGCSGVGKSTFINSLLGLKPYQPGAARVSAGVEGTLVMHPYCMPGFPYIRIWDVPGGSGIDRPADTYFDMHCLDLFDAVLYLHEGRHNALQAMILVGCAISKTPVHVVVTKMDLLVESQLENQGLDESPASVTEAIAVISDTVTKECTALNERYCRDNVSAKKKLLESINSTTDEDVVAQACNVPFFFVSKNFTCRFGSFDAAKVVASMKAAAATRLVHTTPPVSPERGGATTKEGEEASGLCKAKGGAGKEEEEKMQQQQQYAPSAASSLSPQGSPMPFCRESLKTATLSALSQEMDVKEEEEVISCSMCVCV
jgi:GTP-binding protein EngB required for normal cell division